MNNQGVQKRILVVTASVGAGHNSAARAIETYLNSSGKPVEVEVIDATEYMRKTFRVYYAGGFRLAMTRFPTYYGWGFKLTNRPNTPSRNIIEKMRLWQEKIETKSLGEKFVQFRPDLVMHTHFLAPTLFAKIIAKSGLEVKQFVHITDYGVHRFWYSEMVDHWFLPSDVGADRLEQWGVGARQYSVSGMAIHPKWAEKLDRDEVLRQWGLPADKPIVILAGGAEFTCGPVIKVAKGIIDLCPEVCLVVLAGRNKKLLGKLTKLNLTGRIKPVSFTDKVHELVDVARIVVTKPGGISTSECIAKGKVIVLSRPVPGQESGNADFCESHHAAVIAHKYRTIPAEIRKLLDNPQKMQALSKNAQALYKPGTKNICEKILSTLGL